MTEPDHTRTAKGRRALRRAEKRRIQKRDAGDEHLPDPVEPTTMTIPEYIRQLGEPHE